MCPGNKTIQCALEMRLAYVLSEWDYPMCPGNGTSQSALGRGLYNVQWEWD